MAKIDDFGEKIGGARKDLYALNRELRLEDIADWSEYDREKYITKKEAFPLPDYKKLYEQGINREVLFYIKEIRDALPTKPGVYIPHKSSPEEKQQLMHKAQEDYIYTIGKFYEHAMDLKTISDCMNFYEKIKAENIPAIDWLSNRKLLNVVRLDSYGYHSLLTRMRKKQFLYSDEEKILSNYTIFQYDGSNVEKEIDDRQRERLVIKQGGSRYFIYHSNQDPSKWNPNTYFAIDSRTHQIKMANMEDVEQLKKTIVDSEENVTKDKNIPRKKKLVPAQLSNIRPTAEDYRGGKNITGEDMLNTFQFHGGEFGNWENDLDRQTNLNMSFDALNDLVKALGIEHTDISLGGGLSIAYGARGVSNAAAHFEPGMNVINLTKMKGAGSLAHEWGHALDHYIAMQNGDGIGFATEKPKGKMKELMNIIKYNESGQTEYYQNAKLLDLSYGKSGHKGYWQSDVELFARAFASYVRDKLEPDASDYLVGHSEMSGLVEKDGKLVSILISPQGEERRRINEAIDAVIEDLKEEKILHHVKHTKEQEQSIQIYEEIVSDMVVVPMQNQEELRDTTETDVKQEMIVKLTGQPVSKEMQDILKRLSEKQYVSLEEINATKEMKIARSNINYACPTIQLDNRQEIQLDVLKQMNQMGSVEFDENGKVIVDSEGNTLYNGRVERNSRLDIVIGLPASGKSSAIANSISNEFHSKVIDNDEAKKKIPQYNDGWGSGVVHEESQYISDAAFRMAVQNHENIVLPKVGSKAEKLCDSYIIYAKENGYEVNLHYVELDRNIALGRMINRFIEDGRFLEPNLIEKYDNPTDGNRIETAYETVKLHSSVAGYSKWDNDVERGEQPILVESHNLTGNYIKNARRKVNYMKGVIGNERRNERNAKISTIDSRNYGESGRDEPEGGIEDERGQRGYYTQHESGRSATSNEQVLQVVDDQLVSENNKDEIVEAVERSIKDTFSTASSVREENVPMDEKFKQMDRVGEEPTQKQVEYAIRIANLLDVELPDDNSKKAYAEFISENQEAFNRTRYERASSVNILDYARSQGLELKRNGRDYRVANFSGGFIISPDKNNWNYFTADAGGGVIQLCMFLENKTLQEAVDTLVNEDMDMIRHSIEWKPAPEEPKEFILPERNHTNSHVMEYLTQIRGIDKEIVQTMIDQDYIYENTYKSCVFVGRDKEGIPRHASVRSTNTQGDAYKKDVFGSQKKYSFSIPGTSGTLNVFEAPIDVLSYMSIRKMSGEQMNDSYLSLGGTSDKALEQYLEDHNDIKEIKVCTDADEAGNKAAEKIQEKYGDQYRIIREKAMHKDFNEDLIAILESRKEENKSETQKVLSEQHQENEQLKNILQMVNDFSKLYVESSTFFSEATFQERLSEILVEYKEAINSNPEGIVALLPTFFENPNPNEIDIRGNRLWNEFWQALERYGITGDEKFSAEINSIATNPDTQEKALSIMKSIQQYLDDRLYVQSYMKDGNVVNVDCISHYKNIVSNDIIDAVFFRDTENGNVMADDVQENDKQYQEFSVAHHEFIANKEASRIPVVINAFGGPGSGKSVSCMDICQQLKKLGYNAEYVQEYAKDLVYDENWDMLDGSPENQFEILKEQLRRVDRLYGTVDFIVTDSPVLLNSVYNKSLSPQYDNMVTSLYKDFENFTYFVERDTSSYQQEGRIQNLEESQKIDEEIKQLLAEKEVYYGTYNHDTINKIVSNSIKTFNRINHIDEKATAKQVAYAEKIATTLNIDLPEDITKEAYRYFISENQEKFLEISTQVTEDSESTMKYEDYLEKVSQNGNLLKDVPEEYHTEELLLAAVSNWGAAIRNVPADKLTPAIVLASVTQYGTNLRHVPKEMRSEEVCIAAYVNSVGKAIRYAPNEIKDAVKTKAQEILANNNTSISSSKRQVEVEQLQEQGQEWATQISNMLREHETDPEAMVEDIIFASKFYQYSVKNIQIMRRQNPGMTFIASASAFEQMGYHVKNGEKAMIARVPSFSKYVIDENGEYIYASKYTPEIKNKIKQGVLKEHEKLTRYVFRPAFYDISQTDCPVEDYPSMFYMGAPSEMHQEAFFAMKEFTEDSLGFKVMAVDLKSISLRGNCEPDNKIIRVNDKLESTLALSTLCHEIAHGIIHTSKESAKMTTAQKECEADVMAIMLESSLGLAISESRREHLYHAFHTYKDEQAAKEHPYEVTLEKLIDRVQKKVFRPYAEDIKYYLALHLPVDGVENDNVARNLVKDMALFDSAYQLHFNLSIDPEHELFAEDKIELYRTLYQQTKEEYRLGNSFVPKLAVIKDFGKDETFLTSVQFIDKETVDTIKNLSAHVTQEYLPLQIELGDVLAIKENVLEDSQLYIVTEQGLQPLSDKLNQELENKINCGFDVSTEYQCIRNLLQNNIEILSDTIPQYYNHICERFGYTKDVAQTTSNQFMARINLITEGMSSNDKELIAEYVFRTGNYQKAEKYAEKLQKEPGISKQLLQEMRLIDSYKYMLWTIADYEDTHSVSGEKRITTGAYNNASIPLLSENAHSLSQINECFLEIKKHNAQESVKYYSIVTEEEGYRIGYVELDDYVPSIKYSTGVYSSYEEAKEFYNLYLETANSHLVAAAQANHLVDLEKEANLIALSDVTAIGNTIADEKYRFKELGVTENDLLNLLRDKIDNYQDVNSIHTLDASVQILKDFKQTINDFGEKHFVELCNLDDFSDINVMEESLQVANWLSKQREVIANCGQNGIEDVTQLIDMAMDNCVTTADLEQAYNAIDAVVLNSEYSNLKAHFDGYEDYNSAFDTLKSSFVTADKFCYIDYKADDIPMLYTSDPAGNVYKKSLRNEWTGSVQEIYGKLQKAGYEVCSNFDDFKAYAMNNRLAVPGAPERKKEGVYVRVIESTSDLLTKGQTLSVYDFKNHMDKIYSGSSEANNCVTYKLVTRNNQEIQSYIDTYSGDVNMNVYEKLYDKAKEQSPELCKLIGKQYYQDVIDFSERHLMKPLLEQLKEQGKTEIDSAELQNLTSSCDKLKEVIKELDLSPAEAEILKLNVGSMQVGQVADIQRQMQLQQNQQLQKQRNKQSEGISLV